MTVKVISLSVIYESFIIRVSMLNTRMKSVSVTTQVESFFFKKADKEAAPKLDGSKFYFGGKIVLGKYNLQFALPLYIHQAKKWTLHCPRQVSAEAIWQQLKSTTVIYIFKNLCWGDKGYSLPYRFIYIKQRNQCGIVLHKSLLRRYGNN